MSRIAAKFGDVLLDPLQDLSLVEEADVVVNIAAVCVARGHETIRPYAIVEEDHDHLVIGCRDDARTIFVGVGVLVEAASGDVDEDGKL